MGIRRLPLIVSLMCVQFASAQMTWEVAGSLGLNNASGFGFRDEIAKSSYGGYDFHQYAYSPPRPMPSFGVSARYNLSQRFFVKSDLTYRISHRVGVSKYSIVEPTAKINYSHTDEVRMQYIENLMSINVAIGKRQAGLRPFIGLGGGPAAVLGLRAVSTTENNYKDKVVYREVKHYRLNADRQFVGFQRWLWPVAVEMGFTSGSGWSFSLAAQASKTYRVYIPMDCPPTVDCRYTGYDEFIRNVSVHVTRRLFGSP